MIYGIMCHYIWIYLVLPYYRVLLKVSYVVSSLTSTTDPWCLWEWLNWCSLHSRRGLLCLLLWGLLTSHGSCTRCTPKGGRCVAPANNWRLSHPDANLGPLLPSNKLARKQIAVFHVQAPKYSFIKQMSTILHVCALTHTGKSPKKWPLLPRKE